MSKLLMLSGLPSSGKSTYAEELVNGGGNWVRVNRDLLRTMLHFDKWSGKNEDVTVMTEKSIVARCLWKGLNVVVDDTNLGLQHKDMWKSVADTAETPVMFEIKTFDTDVWECIKRDEKREKKVGRHVIMNMAMQYDFVPDMKNIVVCDIDGTVADGTHRQHHLDGETKDWKTYFSLMHDDVPRMEVYNAAMDEGVSEDAELVFVSARPEDYRKETEDWLHKHGMDYMHLIMRPQGNKRPDTEVKQKVLDKYLKNYNIVKVYDDRPAVIRMWRENGLKVEDVGNGIEF
jgi:predicted kinase